MVFLLTSTSVYFEAGIYEYFLFFRFNFIGKLVLFVRMSSSSRGSSKGGSPSKSSKGGSPSKQLAKMNLGTDSDLLPPTLRSLNICLVDLLST